MRPTLLLVMTLLAFVPQAIADPAIPLAPEYYVLDETSSLNPAELRAAETALVEHDRAAGEQIMLGIFSQSPADPSAFTKEVYKQWQIGERGNGQGLLILLFPSAHRSRIEIGLGMEGELPNQIARKIEARGINPQLNDVVGATATAIQQVLTTIDSPLVLSGRLNRILAPLVSQERSLSTTVASARWAWLPFLLLGFVLLALVLWAATLQEIHYTDQGWFKVQPWKLRKKSHRGMGAQAGVVSGSW